MSNLTTNSTSINATTPPSSVAISYLPLQVVIGILTVIVFIIGFFGNLTVLLTIAKNKSQGMNTLMYYLIGNLAVYDILVMLISLPMTIAQDLSFKWPFGSFLCHVAYNLPLLFVVGSISTMIAIAVDRYLVVLHAANPFSKETKKSIVTTAIFLVALAVTIPSIVFTRYSDTFPGYPQCSIQYFTSNPTEQQLFLQVYTSVTFSVLFVAPLIVVVCLYFQILYVLRQRTNNTEARFNQAYSRANRHTIKMMLLVTVTFIMCWVPLYICFFLLAFNQIPRNAVQTFYLIYASTHLVSYCNSALNPLIYALFTAKFRAPLIDFFTCRALKRCMCGDSKPRFRANKTRIIRIAGRAEQGKSRLQ